MEVLICLGVVKAAAVGVYIFSHSVTDEKAPVGPLPTYNQEPQGEGSALAADMPYEPQKVKNLKRTLGNSSACQNELT